MLVFFIFTSVPARNEYDEMDFSRVIVATVAYLLAALSLIPFQTFQ